MATENSSKVMLKNVRFAYAHNAFEPSAASEGGEKKYSVCILINKKDKANVDAINAVCDQLRKEFADKNKGKVPSTYKMPLRDGDEKDGEEYQGHYFINATSKQKPGVIDAAKNAISKEDDKFYSGCFGHVTVNFYGFDVSGNKGIACGLNNIMKTKDGDRLSGKSSATDDFNDVEVEDNDDDLL
jgi:hypothetical protein